MCAQIIEARVKQKKDTLANWNANQLVLLDGEQAFVIGDSGQPINFKIGDGTKRFSDLPWWISYDQGQYVQVVGNALPTPTVELGYTFVGPGTYTHAGGNVVAPDGRFSQLVWNGTTWSLKDMGSLPQTETVDNLASTSINEALSANQGRELDVKKVDNDILFDVVTTPSRNKFNKSTVISGFYIDTTTGELKPEVNSAVSDWINVTGWENSYLSGRNQNAVDNVRFKDALGNIMTPLNEAGNPIVGFATGRMNGLFPIRSNAVAIQFQVRFVGNGTYDNIQFEEGVSQTSYQPFGDIIERTIKPTLLPAGEVELKEFTLSKEGNNFTVTTPMGDKKIIINLLVSPSGNKLFNFKDAFLDNGKRLHGTNTDDISPAYFNGGYIGGNHGNIGLRTITANSHGKTIADVGAVYADSIGIKFYILRIPTPNTIEVISENTQTNGSWKFENISGSVLSYQSNGQSTTPINITGSVAGQLYPAVKINTQKILVDGKEITSNGVYSSNDIQFIEDYDILDTVDVVNNLLANRPPGGYTEQPSLTNGRAMTTVKLIYKVVNGGFLVLSDFIVKPSINLSTYYLSQSAYIKPSWATEYKRYIPNTLPIVTGSRTFDYRTGESLLSAPTANQSFNNTYWENSTKIPNRVIDVIDDGTNKLSFAFGYLPIGSNRIDIANIAILISANTRKIYPGFVDSKTNTAGFQSWKIYSGAMYRVYSESEQSTSEVLVEHEGKGYLFLDFHSTGIKKIAVPKSLQGKKLTVTSKSTNLIVLSNLLTTTIEMNVQSLDNGYSYIEAVIE